MAKVLQFKQPNTIREPKPLKVIISVYPHRSINNGATWCSYFTNQPLFYKD